MQVCKLDMSFVWGGKKKKSKPEFVVGRGRQRKVEIICNQDCRMKTRIKYITSRNKKISALV